MEAFKIGDEISCHYNGNVENMLDVGARYIVRSYHAVDNTVRLFGVGDYEHFTATRFHLALPVAQPDVAPGLAKLANPENQSIYEHIKAEIEDFSTETEALDEYNQGYLDCMIDLMADVFSVDVKTQFAFVQRKAA